MKLIWPPPPPFYLFHILLSFFLVVVVYPWTLFKQCFLTVYGIHVMYLVSLVLHKPVQDRAFLPDHLSNFIRKLNLITFEGFFWHFCEEVLPLYSRAQLNDLNMQFKPCILVSHCIKSFIVSNSMLVYPLTYCLPVCLSVYQKYNC